VNRPHRDPCRILSERPATFYQVPFGYYRIVPIKDSLVVRIVVAEPAVTTEGLHAVDVQVVRNIRLPDQRQTYTAAWAATKTSTRPHSRSQRASSAALTACLRCAFASTMRLTMPNKSKVLRRAGLSHRAREVAGGTESSQTHCWREMDSNHRYLQAELPLPLDRDWAETWILRICANSAHRPEQKRSPGTGNTGASTVGDSCLEGNRQATFGITLGSVNQPGGGRCILTECQPAGWAPLWHFCMPLA